MSEYTELTAKIEALEKRVKYLEDTFATLATMNKSGEMGQYIAQRQRALAASKLVNAAAGTQKLNADAQQQVIDQLAAEKAAMDARIEEAIRASAQNTPAEDDLAEQFTYRDVPGGVEIQGFNGFEVGEELVIPQKINEKLVIGIGQSAFENMTFNKAILPQGLLYIENRAFAGCKRLHTIMLPMKLHSIGESAFGNCVELDEIVIPSLVKNIGRCAFSGSGIRKIAIPEGIKTIPNCCFSRCEKMENVILNEGLKNIEFDAFSSTAIKKYVLPSSVEKVEKDALKNTILSSDRRVIHIAVLGKKTQIEDMPRDAIVYCNAGSEIQKIARVMGINVKPLSEFKKA